MEYTKLHLRGIVSILLYIILSTTLYSCSESSFDQDRVDYGSISLIDFSEELKINESENFIPSNLIGFYAIDNGQLLIAERTNPGIHQFNAKGQYVEQIARSGRGPGELSGWYHPHFNGTVLTASNNPGHILSVYQQSSNETFHHTQTVNIEYQGVFKGIKGVEPVSFYTLENKSTQRLRAPEEFTESNINIVTKLGDSVMVKDSIIFLQHHSDYVHEFKGGGIRSYDLPYRYSDIFKPLPNGRTLTARPDSQVIRIRNSDFKSVHELQLDISKRSVTENDLEFHFSDYDSKKRQKMEELIKEFKPAFMDVFLDDENRFWLWTDETKAGNEYVILSYNGEPLGKILLPSEQKISLVKGGRFFVLNQPQNSAPSAIVYSYDLTK